jgi:hypothetical protein
VVSTVKLLRNKTQGALSFLFEFLYVHYLRRGLCMLEVWNASCWLSCRGFTVLCLWFLLAYTDIIKSGDKGTKF